MELTLIPKESIPGIWALVRPLIEDALVFDTDGEDCLGDIYHKLCSGALHCHVLADGEGLKLAVVCQVYDTPTARICSINWLGAAIPLVEFMPHLAELEQWAKDGNCDVIRVNGRPGWKKFMEGYKHSYEVISKRI